MHRRTLVAAAAAAAAAALVLAGCGGASPRSPDKLSADHFKQDFVDYASCMRAHGLQSYPDPRFGSDGDGVKVTISPGDVDPNTPAFKSADTACHDLLPESGVAGGGRSITATERANGLRFAQCVRDHGVPQFPDPDHDGAFDLPTTVDPQAPALTNAMRACTRLRPSSVLLSTRA
jgi:hypothetical protein